MSGREAAKEAIKKRSAGAKPSGIYLMRFPPNK